MDLALQKEYTGRFVHCDGECDARRRRSEFSKLQLKSLSILRKCKDCIWRVYLVQHSLSHLGVSVRSRRLMNMRVLPQCYEAALPTCRVMHKRCEHWLVQKHLYTCCQILPHVLRSFQIFRVQLGMPIPRANVDETLKHVWPQCVAHCRNSWANAGSWFEVAQHGQPERLYFDQGLESIHCMLAGLGGQHW